MRSDTPAQLLPILITTHLIYHATIFILQPADQTSVPDYFGPEPDPFSACMLPNL